MTEKRAYSTLVIKDMTETPTKRTFTGIASTPSTDRQDDIVEPKGLRFKLPFPLLWQHDSSDPIGWVTAAKVSDAGVEVDCEVATVDEPGPLQDRLTLAWQMLKSKLVRGLSIGFNPLETARIEGTYGTRFIAADLLELSAVTIAANQDCSILSIKAADLQAMAATGQKRKGISRLVDHPPGVSGNTKAQPASSGLFVARNQGNTVKTIQEQISAFQVKKESLQGQVSEIVNKSLESGETLDAETKQKRSDLASEIREIDEHITMLKDSESLMLTKATPVAPRSIEQTQNQQTTHEPSGVRGTTVVTAQPALPKGIAFTRIVALLATHGGKAGEALKTARDMYPNDPNLHSVLKMVDGTPRNFLQKAAVSGGTTVGSTWASPLVFYQNAVADFVEFLRPKTIIGRIPGMTMVPFKVSVPRQIGGGSAYWVGEGQPKPLTNLAFDRVIMDITKIATIAVITDELARLGTPSAEAMTRDQLAAAIIQQMDSDFVDPANTGIVGVKPASVTAGVAPITSGGNTETLIRQDILKIFSPWIINNLDPTTGVWIMPASTALALSLMVNGLGQPSFPGITMSGGTFWGMPVVVSEAAGLLNGTTGGNVVLLNAKNIMLADDGQVTVDASTEASLEMLTNPTNNSATPTGATNMVSMFQTDSIAIRAERYINWIKSRATAVQYLNGVHWGQ